MGILESISCYAPSAQETHPEKNLAGSSFPPGRGPRRGAVLLSKRAAGVSGTLTGSDGLMLTLVIGLYF